MTEIMIGGRKIPLLYTTCEMIAIQDEIGCTAFQLKDQVFGLKQEDEDDPNSIRLDVVSDTDKMKKLCTLIRILGNAGLEEAGEEPNLTDKWIMRKIKPAMIIAYAIATMAEISEGNRMESPKAEEKNGAVVDEGLEEQMGKKQQGN